MTKFNIVNYKDAYNEAYNLPKETSMLFARKASVEPANDEHPSIPYLAFGYVPKYKNLIAEAIMCFKYVPEAPNDKHADWAMIPDEGTIGEFQQFCDDEWNQITEEEYRELIAKFAKTVDAQKRLLSCLRK